MIELNDLETARFGLCAGKLVDSSADPEVIEAEARRLGVRLLTTRVDVSALPRVHALERAGYQLMDTLVYYRRPAEPAQFPTNGLADVRFRLACPSDAKANAGLARKGFNQYIGHYHADPRLNRAAADAAYENWAETSTINSAADTPVLVGEVGTKIVCFLTMRRNAVSEVELVLSAVDPDYQARGLYSALIQQSLVHSAEIGASEVVTSTQINNHAVQRVWCRHGFTPYKAVYTFHKWFD